MASGGGRGQRLAQLLEKQQQEQRPGSQSDGASAAPAAPRGRAALLQQMLQKHEEAIASGDPRAASGGRGQTLRAALALVNPGGAAPSVPTPGPPAQAAAPSSPPVQAMERLVVADVKDSEPVIRMGESGKRINATANYIRLHMDRDKGFFEYEVRYEPSVDALNLRFKYLSQNLDALGGVRNFDGVTLYLPILLAEKVTVFKIQTDAGEQVEMRIIFKRKKTPRDCIHFYNVLFKRLQNIQKFVPMGRQYYDPRGSINIPQHQLEIWPGYVTAVDEYEDGVMLCCDSSHRVLRTMTVLDVCRDMMRRDERSYKQNLTKEVVGQSVLTRYNNKTYRIDDIDWKQTPASTFTQVRGGVEQQVSFAAYYQQHYNLTLKDLGQPLLLSKIKDKVLNSSEKVERIVCLVPELCYMTGLTDTMRADFKVMKDIATHTRITPNQRQLALKKFVHNIRTTPEACKALKEWGLAIDEDTVNLSARVVDCENIYFGNNAMVRGTPQADWGMKATNNRVLGAVDLTNWCVLHVAKDRSTAEDYANMMATVCPQMGIQCSKATMVQVRDDRIDSFVQALKSSIRPGVQCVVILCPSARDDRYAAIKKICCAEMPIASQVINSRTLFRKEKNRSIVQKIALQINCKLGGTLWSVKIPFDNIMIVGIDTYHDAVSRGKSVGGFVASINQTLTRWYSRVCIQAPQQELIDNLKVNFSKAIDEYFKVNHRYPDRIIIYRDGVGDGQLAQSRDFEVEQFKACFRTISETYEPKLTMIVCQKRINTRIFASLGSGGHNNLDNPPPGTIVDNTVNRRSWYDFFLVSQHVRQGTVTPTHYVVVYDGCEMKTDHIQRLTYKLCHLYYNWPGTIRVPAPVQYAHKLAQLVGQNIHREPAECLSDKLYFL